MNETHGIPIIARSRITPGEDAAVSNATPGRGGTVRGGLVVSPLPADFAQWCDGSKWSVGICRQAPPDRPVDLFAAAGIWRIVPLQGGDPMGFLFDMHKMTPGMPHDRIEPLRSIRSIVDHPANDRVMPFSIVAE